MTRLHKMTKTQVIAQVKKTGTWNGFVVACKMYPTNHTACPLSLVWDNDRGVCVKDQTSCEHNPLENDPFNYDHFPLKLDTWINNWSYYNTSSEEGNYAHFYRAD